MIGIKVLGRLLNWLLLWLRHVCRLLVGASCWRLVILLLIIEVSVWHLPSFVQILCVLLGIVLRLVLLFSGLLVNATIHNNIVYVFNLFLFPLLRVIKHLYTLQLCRCSIMSSVLLQVRFESSSVIWILIWRTSRHLTVNLGILALIHVLSSPLTWVWYSRRRSVWLGNVPKSRSVWGSLWFVFFFLGRSLTWTPALFCPATHPIL